MNRPCLDCGAAIAWGSRCKACQKVLEAKRNRDPKRSAYRDPAYRSMTPTGRCAICKVRPATQRDHIYPLALGGSNHPSNIQFVCGPCNASKKDRV